MTISRSSGRCAAFIDAGLPRDDLLEIARILSLRMSQTAEAIRGPPATRCSTRVTLSSTVGLRYAEAVEQLAPS